MKEARKKWVLSLVAHSLDQKRKGLQDEHATGGFVATAIRSDSSIPYALSFDNCGVECATRRPVRNLPQDKAAYLSDHVSLLAQYFRCWLWAGRRGGHRHYLRVRPQLGGLCQRRRSHRGRHYQHGSDYGVLSRSRFSGHHALWRGTCWPAHDIRRQLHGCAGNAALHHLDSLSELLDADTRRVCRDKWAVPAHELARRHLQSLVFL